VGAQVCCPREDGWDSGAGAVTNRDWHGISQRRVLMRTDFAVRAHVLHVKFTVSLFCTSFPGPTMPVVRRAEAQQANNPELRPGHA